MLIDFDITSDIPMKAGRKKNNRFKIREFCFLFTLGYNAIQKADSFLIHNSRNVVLISSSVKDSLGYSDAILAVTDQASERDAYARLMVLLGDKIVDELLRSETLNNET